jgi:hypothetical protein
VAGGSRFEGDVAAAGDGVAVGALTLAAAADASTTQPARATTTGERQEPRWRRVKRASRDRGGDKHGDRPKISIDPTVRYYPFVPVSD